MFGQQHSQSSSGQLEVDLRRVEVNMLGRGKKREGEGTDLSLGDTSEGLDQLQPLLDPLLLLDLWQEADDFIHHLDNGLFELPMSLGEQDDGRAEEGKVRGSVAEGGDGGEDGGGGGQVGGL